ncbi:hypothetical protein H5410_061768 [Solanum commersonii]|uniref:Uncharacterized protein n=1 Tax=Solanum commersonii TaxID=4109 RepID=A0A9J5W8X8_SOLCO|nr:hypothetical protein H5410_061768 [Solanum commersonii]
MLPIPKRPHENLLLAMTDEVEGGKDGGVQEKHTNLQEGVKDTSQDKIDETSQVQNSPGTPNMITGNSGVQQDINSSMHTTEEKYDLGTSNEQNQLDGNDSQMKPHNNKSRDTMSNKKRDAIKRKQ